MWELNWKLPAKKNEYTRGNNISRTYSENLRIFTDKPITKIINNQLDIKLGQVIHEELDSVQRKIENRKAAGIDKIISEV